MASLAAVNMVGESIVALLRTRRDLLAADGLLGPVPATLDISQASLGRLATQPTPASGCTLTCYRVAMSDHPTPRVSGSKPAANTVLAVDLHYLLTAWSSSADVEQAIISWSMLELLAYPVLDQSLLQGSGVWARDETIQLVPQALDMDALFRIWSALQLKYRLSTTFCARVVRISHGDTHDWLPVVATRFGFADAQQREPA
jgi:Pvc16 N-terminal domain